MLVILGPTPQLKQMCDLMMQRMSSTSTASCTLSRNMLPLCTEQHHYFAAALSCLSVRVCMRACMLACGSTFMHGFTSWFVYEPVFTVSCHLYAHLVQGGLNAMHLAAAGGYIEIIKFLRPMFGARVHEKDDWAFTPLYWAAQMGHCQVARYLIEELNMIPQDRDMVCGVLRGNV